MSVYFEVDSYIVYIDLYFFCRKLHCLSFLYDRRLKDSSVIVLHKVLSNRIMKLVETSRVLQNIFYGSILLHICKHFTQVDTIASNLGGGCPKLTVWKFFLLVLKGRKKSIILALHMTQKVGVQNTLFHLSMSYVIFLQINYTFHNR